MKQCILSLLLLLAITPLIAQDKASLTKDETISYLNRVLNKAVGFKCINTGTGKPTAPLETASFTSSGDDVIYTYRVAAWYRNGGQDCSGGCGGNYTYSYKFNPAYITEVKFVSNFGDPVCTLKLSFSKSNLVREKWIEHGLVPKNSGDKVIADRTSGEAIFYFFMADQSDFEKLKKAILYLRDLCKAEDDPFAEQ